MRRKCEFCGEIIEKDDLFCKSCGNEVKYDNVVEDAVIEDPNKKKQDSTFILSVVVLLLLIIVSLGAYYLLK